MRLGGLPMRKEKAVNNDLVIAYMLALLVPFAIVGAVALVVAMTEFSPAGFWRAHFTETGKAAKGRERELDRLTANAIREYGLAAEDARRKVEQEYTEARK